MKTVDIDLGDAARNATLRVRFTGTLKFGVRLTAVKLLLGLMALVSPFKIEVTGPFCDGK